MQKIIKRNLEPIIDNWLFRGKTILLYGARQVGKTTLVKSLLSKYEQEDGYFNCEIQSVRSSLESKEPSLLKRFIGNKKIVVFDEAQYVPGIGLTLKLLADTFPELQVIATGSSSFELANNTSEPLTGRALTFELLPVSYAEMGSLLNPAERFAHLEFFLQYGMYPDIVQASETDARILLDNLSSKYLYKDVLEFENIKKSDVLFKLLQMLALQIGHEVSYHELSLSLKVNVRTIERYIDLLEKAFVIFRLRPFSRNLRKEISKKNKIFFFDVGIRNSILQQYQPPALRLDKGGLWENFFIVERMKFQQSQQIKPNCYFWRTHDNQEIDYIEEYNGQISAFEIKWNAAKASIPAVFTQAYPNSIAHIVDTENFEQFLEKQA